MSITKTKQTIAESLKFLRVLEKMKKTGNHHTIALIGLLKATNNKENREEFLYALQKWKETY